MFKSSRKKSLPLPAGDSGATPKKSALWFPLEAEGWRKRAELKEFQVYASMHFFQS